MEAFEHLAKDGVLLHGTLQQYSDAFEVVDSDHDGEPRLSMHPQHMTPMMAGPQIS